MDADPSRGEEQFRRMFSVLAAEQPLPKAPSAEQLDRWAAVFAAEMGSIRRRRTRRRLAAAALVGAAVAVLAVVLKPTSPPADAPVVAQAVTAFGGIVVRKGEQVVRSLAPGADISAADLVESGARSGLGVMYRTADVRLDADTRVVFHADRLELRSGRLYLDVPALPGPAGGRTPLQVETPMGTFSHLGTQFLVSVSEAEVEGAVREGTIVLRQGGREVTLVATPEHARKVVTRAPGVIEESAVSRSGPLWTWALRTAPGIILAGRSPDDVLRWVARERGQPLDYADEATRRLAVQTRLGGGVGGELGVDEALRAVDRMSGLRVDATGEALRVTRGLRK